MSVSHLPRWAIAASILLVFGAACRNDCAADSPASSLNTAKKLSADDRAAVNGLLQKYRAAGSDVEKKQEICLKVLAIGPAAAPLMLAAVERDLQPEMRKYLTKFQAQAVAAARQKAAKVDLNQVMAMRVAVHDLQKLGDAFTKEVIVEKIEPVVQKLKAALLLDRGEVLEKSPELKTERKKLESYAEMYERCRTLLPTQPTKQVPKKAGSNGNPARGVPANSSPNNGLAERKTIDQPASLASYFQGEEELAASLAIPQDPRTRSILAMNAKLAENLDPEEARAIMELNLTRTLLGLPAMAIDLRLCEAAREHCQDMERLKFFSHESPVEGKKSFVDRARLVGATASGENIFTGTSSGKSAHEGWFHSPGHHRNQMGNATRVGVGRSGTLFTQMFGS
jgi:uncharacterized protein YkwD